MLSKEDNELLTRVGPGTPAGELLRRYWLPVLLAEELPSAACPPVRVGVLGESLVAFRDSAGRIGLLDAYCAHRGANLFWGRNEAGGLRCVYHGWKYDVSGRCIDMPNAPEGSGFEDRVRVPAYPAREMGGVIWAYLGPSQSAPGLPELEWMLVPADHRYLHKRLQVCNYLQNVEGEIDSSHVSFLHRSLDGEAAPSTIAGQTLLHRSRHYAPTFHLRETDYGLAIGARREWDDDSFYWRVTQFLMPTYTMIPSEPGHPISFTAAVPVDDTRMWGYTVTWRPDRPLSPDDVARIESWTGIYAEVDPTTYQPVRNMGNDYLIDRALQRTQSFTGIRGIREQDLAVQEDQRGPIADRSRERLGAADAAIAAARKLLLRAVHDLEHGVEPASARVPAAYRVRSVARLAPRALGFEELDLPRVEGWPIPA